jgi:hypothetical protein
MMDEKELAKRAYIDAWETAIGREETTGVQRRTMLSNFERWWSRNA